MSLGINQAFICDAVRTPFGRYRGALSGVRTDDLASVPIAQLLARNPGLDPAVIDDVIFGCANRSGEDNRNVARTASLLARLPVTFPASTVNRLCGSGMDAIALAARSIRSNEAHVIIAGGVESISRAPFVMSKAEAPFSRRMAFVNPTMKALYGTDSMPGPAENVAVEHGVSRVDQDAFALRSQQRAAIAITSGVLAEEIVPVDIPQKNGGAVTLQSDEQPRPASTLQGLSKLPLITGPNGTITTGNASAINDGSAALLIASKEAVESFGLGPLGRVVATASAGVPPRLMGIGTVPATKKFLSLIGLSLEQMDVIEFNEAFAAQATAVLRQLNIPDDAAHVNPNGGAIALGHRLGASGARFVMTALRRLHKIGGRYALCTMCIGVGQGIAMVVERL